MTTPTSSTAAVATAGPTDSSAWTVVESPVGPLLLVAGDDALTGVRFSPFEPPPGDPDDDAPVLAAARDQLAAYFAGELRDFDLPLAPRGTPFRLRVWEALRAVPYGTTCSYGQLAARLGLTGRAARAVGLANGANPLPVVVPCHRVIGADGSLTGYGGGIERKRRLLALESPGLF